MPKLGKVQFDALGKEMRSDEAKAAYELELYYTQKDDYFYFERGDVLKCFPKYDYSQREFEGCKTREMALIAFKILVDKAIVPKRMLAVTITIGLNAMTEYSERKPKGTGRHDQSLMRATSIETHYSKFQDSIKHTLGVHVKKLLCYELTDNRNEDLLISAHDTWTPETYRQFTNRREHEKSLLVEWTEERERYLLALCKQLDNIGANLLLFLASGLGANGSDFGKFIDTHVQPALAANIEVKE